MISTDHLPQLMGAEVYDDHHEKIGSVGQIYVDPTTGEPLWAAVRTGLFGMSESFVPLTEAEERENEIIVHYEKEFVKDAPRIDPEGALTDDEEARLYDYYGITEMGSGDAMGMGGAGGTSYTDSAAFTTSTDGQTDFDRSDDYARGDRSRDMGRDTGYDTSGPTTDDAMTRSEERLNVGTERMQTGRARLRKFVVTEDQTVTVPVSREEVRLEREPITDDNIDAAMSGPELSDEEHEVTLEEERPVIDKKTVPVERVRLDKETVTDEQTFREPVSREEIELDDDSDRRM